MIATNFEEANTVFGPPPELTESQCMRVPGYVGTAIGGSMDGSLMVVVAWLPNQEELKAIQSGKPIFLTCCGGLPPHFLTTNFQDATHPA